MHEVQPSQQAKTIEERRDEFTRAVLGLPGVVAEPQTGTGFGFSNSARTIEGGLFAANCNLEAYSRKLSRGEAAARQLVLVCVLNVPPQDECYFALVIGSDVERANNALLKLLNGGARNNNTKVYITESGEAYFQTQGFVDSLVAEPPQDPEYLAKIDAIHFGIWPPAASARRSLLAREFVGYLGRLIGRDKVHEMQVWEDPAALRAGMLRRPAAVPIDEITSAISALGGYYPGGEIQRFHAALNFHPSKHFVILSGLSGTGKTQLAMMYAKAIHGVGKNEKDPFLFVCAVRPEWTDPAGVTGYHDVLSNRYVVPQFLDAVLLATAQRNSAVFVVLDEMNLARVEYYLSDVLSAMEIRGDLNLHSNAVPLEGSNGIMVHPKLPMPTNLYLIGTVNVDETTNAISDKVLDRSVMIEMSSVDLSGYLADLVAREPDLAPARKACEGVLAAVQKLLAKENLGFGYRVAEEVLRYSTFAEAVLKEDPTRTIDHLMVQKVLVKLRGDERQRGLLKGLTDVLKGLPRSKDFLDRLGLDLNEYGSFRASR